MTYEIKLKKRTQKEKDAYMLGIITENVLLKKQIDEANKILAPQLDLLKADTKFPKYKLLLTYNQIKRLREALK